MDRTWGDIEIGDEIWGIGIEEPFIVEKIKEGTLTDTIDLRIKHPEKCENERKTSFSLIIGLNIYDDTFYSKILNTILTPEKQYYDFCKIFFKT